MTSDRLGVTGLGFIEIDDVPDGIEILADHRFSEQMGRTIRGLTSAFTLRYCK
jgi:hypothetical protein